MTTPRTNTTRRSSLQTTIVSLLPIVALATGRVVVARVPQTKRHQASLLQAKPSSRAGRFLPSDRYYVMKPLEPQDFLKDHRQEESNVGADTVAPTTFGDTTSPTMAPTTPHTKAPSSAQVVEDCSRLEDSTLFEEYGEEQVNLSGDDDSPGDIWVFDSNQVSTDGYPSGTSAGRCILLEDVGSINNLYCTMVFEFPEGSIVLSGVFDNLAAVAGSECFAGLAADVTLGSNSDQDAFAYKFTPATLPYDCNLDLYDGPWNSEGGYTLVDWDDSNGPSPGDSYVFERREVISSGGAQGFVDGECLVLLDTRDEKPFCSITFDFGDDKLFLMGVFDDMMITAGLGCFLGASGKVEGNSGDGSNEFILDLDDLTSVQNDDCQDDIFDNTWIEAFGEAFVDYGVAGPGPGDVYVFEDKQVTIPNADGDREGSLSGRCMFLQRTDDTFCSLVVTLSEGSIALTGFYSKMSVAGGSGCFRGITGHAVGSDNEQGFTYDFDVAFVRPDDTPSTLRPTSSPTRQPTLSPTNPPTAVAEMQTSLPVASPILVEDTVPPTLQPSEFDECRRVSTQIVESQDDIFLDILEDGFSPGDTYLFDTNQLGSIGFEAGESAGRCVALENTDEDNNLYCSIVFEFPEGSIVLQGVFRNIDAISGAGCYRSLTAEVVLGSMSGVGFTYDFFPQSSRPQNCPTGLFQGQWTEPGGYQVVDWDKEGLSIGDIVVFDSQQVNIPGDRSAILEGECTVLLEIDEDKPFCSVTFIVGDSNLYAMGVFDNMVISGGTGCFFNTSGRISGRTLEDGSKQFELTVDDENSNEDTACSGSSLFDEAWIEEFGEELVDYDGLGESPGDAYVFDNKAVTIPTSNGDLQAVSAGRCVFLQDLSTTFCSITLTTSQGAIALQGFFGMLYIAGGSGCFRGLAGMVSGGESDDGFTYNFDIE